MSPPQPPEFPPFPVPADFIEEIVLPKMPKFPAPTPEELASRVPRWRAEFFAEDGLSGWPSANDLHSPPWDDRLAVTRLVRGSASGKVRFFAFLPEQARLPDLLLTRLGDDASTVGVDVYIHGDGRRFSALGGTRTLGGFVELAPEALGPLAAGAETIEVRRVREPESGGSWEDLEQAVHVPRTAVSYLGGPIVEDQSRTEAAATPTLISESEAAKRLGIRKETAARWLRELGYSRRVGGAWRVVWTAVERHLATQESDLPPPATRSTSTAGVPRRRKSAVLGPGGRLD